MVELLKSDSLKAFLKGLALSFVVSLGFLLYHGADLKKAIFGFFYFFITPILALPHLHISLVVIFILLMLFRRASGCMRESLRFLAYAVLLLHWLAWGLYCSRFVVI
jgi:uncharacterized membrane protein